MKIILSYRLDTYRNKEVPTYSLSFYNALVEKGYEVLRIGEGWEYKYVEEVPNYKDYSLLVDVDCGRDSSGNLHFRYQDRKPPIPSAVRLIDALDVNIPVLTTKGWRTILEISPGDAVFNRDGNPTTVLRTSPIYLNRNCYELKFESGEKLIADSTHKWEVFYLKSEREYTSILTTEELFETFNYANYKVKITQALNTDDKDLLIEPYFLGVWLGDGSQHSAVITSEDSSIFKEFAKHYKVKPVLSHGESRKYECRIGKDKNNTAFWTKLRLLNVLNNKHIPLDYLTSSYFQRLELLQGLMDTDGECAKDGQCYFHNKDLNLISQVRELICSLGIKSYLSTHLRSPNKFTPYYYTMYRLSFRTNFSVFKLKRKYMRQPKKLQRKQKTNYWNLISIKPTQSIPVKCLYVENKDHTFLIGKSFISTHNSHGYPSLHRRIAPNYNDVFFAVWAQRDLFSKHPSAHFCPNASDDKYFDYQNHLQTWWNPEYDVAFFGTKHGLDRADILKEICEKNNWKYDIREVGRAGKPRWPRTAEVMSNSKVLWNHGQKHDINQRVFESMLVNKPLITDLDSESGLEKLFTEGKHFLGYRSREELEIQLKWCIKAPKLPQEMARKAYVLVKEKHLVKHRVEQILEVCEL